MNYFSDTHCYEFSVGENDYRALNTIIIIEAPMKKFVALCGIAGVLTLGATSVMAGSVSWSVNLGGGGYYPPPPVYYSPPPMYNNYSNYYAPPVIYGSQAQTYNLPPPVMYAPAPVVIYGYRDRNYPVQGYGHHHHHHDHRGGYHGPRREYRDYRR